MTENKNKKMKSIGHKPNAPRTKKEKEPTNGGPSNKGK